MTSLGDQERLLELARIVGDDWKYGPYYDEAEAAMEYQWQAFIWPMISGADFTCTIEVAAGHGRNSERLRRLAERLYLVDINMENIEFLKQRFAGVDGIVILPKQWHRSRGHPGRVRNVRLLVRRDGPFR
jgi:hypothetical protein